MKKRKRFTVLFSILIVLSISLMGCSGDDKENKDANPTGTTGEFKEEIVLKVGDQEVRFSEIMLYMLSEKEKMENIYGKEVWDYPLSQEGKTYADALKERVLENIIYTKTVCAQSSALEMSLSEDEKMDVDEYVAEFMKGFTEEDLKKYEFTAEDVKKVYSDNLLATKIYESLTLNADTDVSDEEARQVVLYYILLAKYSFDEQGQQIDYTEEQLKDLESKVEEIHKRALETTDFYNLAEEVSDDSDELEIIVGRGDMSSELEEEAFKLKQGEVSDVVENDTGYFIFYCAAEMDEDATAEKKEEIIEERQEELFNETYLKWAEDAKYELNDELWNKISLKEGAVTISQDESK